MWGSFTKKFLILVLGIFSSVPCFSKGHEFSMGSGPLVFFGNATGVDITGGYKYRFFDWLQVGPELMYHTSKHRDVSASAFTLYFGPTFNLDNPANAYLISAGIVWRKSFSEPRGEAIAYDENGEEIKDPSGFGFGFFLGKRFNISGGFSFQPMGGIISAGTFSFVLTPLQFSLSL